MIENVKLITTQNFDDISCDFYKNINDEYLMTREQIGTALGYKNPNKAIEQIHFRHKNRLDKYSCVVKSEISRPLRSEGIDSNGAIQERVFYTRKGIMEICRWSRQPIADKFMDWCWEVIDNLIKAEQQKQTQITNISPQLSMLLMENKYIKNKLSRIEDMVTSLLPPVKHSVWKSDVAKRIKDISIILGIDEKGIKGIYGNIYNRMRNDYGMDVNNYKTEYLLAHKDVANPPAIDIVENYPELKELFESLVDNYISIVTPSEFESEVSPT